MATHSSILAWEIPQTEESGTLSPRGHKESDTTKRLSTHTYLFTDFYTIKNANFKIKESYYNKYLQVSTFLPHKKQMGDKNCAGLALLVLENVFLVITWNHKMLSGTL